MNVFVKLANFNKFVFGFVNFIDNCLEVLFNGIAMLLGHRLDMGFLQEFIVANLTEVMLSLQHLSHYLVATLFTLHQKRFYLSDYNFTKEVLGVYFLFAF
jgi:hypothetical protein